MNTFVTATIYIHFAQGIVPNTFHVCSSEIVYSYCIVYNRNFSRWAWINTHTIIQCFSRLTSKTESLLALDTVNRTRHTILQISTVVRTSRTCRQNCDTLSSVNIQVEPKFTLLALWESVVSDGGQCSRQLCTQVAVRVITAGANILSISSCRVVCVRAHSNALTIEQPVP